MSYSVNLRKLTRKSILGFGYREIKDLSVQMIIDINQTNKLINAYFNLGKITFVDEVLDEIGITEDYRIEKPGKLSFDESNRVVKEIILNNYRKETDIEHMQRRCSQKKELKRAFVNRKIESEIRESKTNLTRYNHGKRY